MGMNEAAPNYLHISPSDHLPEATPIFWHNTITALNDTRFERKIHLDSRTIRQLGDQWWEPYQAIQKLEIIEDLPDQNYDFIRQFRNLESLSIIHSKAFNQLELIEGLEGLQYLQLIQCHQINDISPIISLRNHQKELAHRNTGALFRGLSNINITNCNIRSLEPFKVDQRFHMAELHLSGNYIEDIAPLGVMNHAYLSLSHNQIKDIRPLFESTGANYYGINLRYNFIQDISQIQVHPTRVPGRIKLWIDYNNIPQQQLTTWKQNDYIWIMDK